MYNTSYIHHVNYANIFNSTPVVNAAQDLPEMYAITTRTVYEDAACTPDSFSREDETRFRRATCSVRNATSPIPKLIDLDLGPECSVPSPPTEVAYEPLVGQAERGISPKYIEFMFAGFSNIISNVTVHYYCSGSTHQLHIETGRGRKTDPYDLSCGSMTQRRSLLIMLDGAPEQVVNLHVGLAQGMGEDHLYLTEVQFDAPKRGIQF